MLESPFQYGKLAAGSTFVNRVREKQELKSNLYSGINTMLISPRRWGKSSLVKEAMKELVEERPDVRVCFLDVFTVRSEEEFYQLFAKEVIKATSNSWETWISNATEFLKTLSPKISIGVDPMTDFSIGLEYHRVKENERELLELPEKIACSKGIKIIVCIDEFQSLAGLKNYGHLEGEMRSVWQHHQKVSYCLYGSKRHMMIEIFNSSSKPFYRFGQLMFLQKIDETEWIKFIMNSFRRTGKEISTEDAGLIVEKVKSHSWYVQQLSHFVWSATRKAVTVEIVDKAFSQIVNTNLPLYVAECEALSITQLNLLIAIAKGESVLTGATTMSKYKLGTPQNVSKNKIVLEQKDILDKTVEGFYFLDPVFEFWFKSEYVDG
ncbi:MULTISPECIES: AAA family ATPase [Butyricimonas]|uniref:AAA family ATPase n=1 Tax=Butyricimonas TaxID=574697 RepID=UPI0022E86D17|nr:MULTISPECIES: ATP-binding protein [Butyricimonas]